MTWNLGYVSELDYTFGYYKQLNPLNAQFAAMLSGVEPPKINNACELGFGQGLSFNFHALHTEIDWYGNDFNPQQAQFAKGLNSAGKLNSLIVDDDFATFCSRDDLPSFDFISLHGIWSWVSEKNRKILIKFLEEKLRLGGLVYISYNTMPGWSSTMPLRNLMSEFLETNTSLSDDMPTRIDKVLNLIDELLSKDPLFLRANPSIKARFDEMKSQKSQYLAHEYFNSNWDPVSFSVMSGYLSDAKLTYCAPADLIDLVPSANFSQDQISYLNNINSIIRRETVKDFLTNGQFRQEYWIKGGRKISNDEQEKQILNTSICLINDSPFPYYVERHGRKADLSREVYKPILDILENRKAIKIQKIFNELKKTLNCTLATVTEAVCVLHGGEFVTVVPNDKLEPRLKSNAAKMNEYLINATLSSYDNSYLVSPATRSAVKMDIIQQLFFKAFTSGQSSIEKLTDFAWSVLKAKRQAIMHDGKVLKTEEENIKELKKRADEFLSNRVQHLKAYEMI